MSGSSILYEVPYMAAYHLCNGHETPLNETPATLTLMMVSTTTVDPFAEHPTEEEDFYLHLVLPPNLDLPLPATTQIYRQFPRSYLIPRLDLDGGAGANFTRIEFPERRSQDDVDTFETILAQCTAFLERAPAPRVDRSKSPLPMSVSGSTRRPETSRTTSQSGYPVKKSKSRSGGGYTPGDGVAAGSEYGVPATGSGYVPGAGQVAGSEYGYASPGAVGSHDQDTGRLVLVDEQDGRIVGELSQGFNVVEQGGVMPGSKTPVEITLPTMQGDHNIVIEPSVIGTEYLDDAMHPAYANSSLVSKAAFASTLVVKAATFIGSAMETGASKFTQNTKPVATPLTFEPTTHDRIRKIHTFTTGATGVSSKTIGKANHIAQNFGAHLTGRGESSRGGKKETPAKPGILNKSMIAFSTIADGIETAGKHLLATSANSATTMVGHRYGEEAKAVAHGLTSSVRNVGLVYVDAAGVSRRAVVKSVAKGMVLGSVKGGGDLVLTSDNGSQGQIMFPNQQQYQFEHQTDQNMLKPGAPGAGISRPTTPTPGGPPAYTLPGQQQQQQQLPPTYNPAQNASYYQQDDSKNHPGGNYF